MKNKKVNFERDYTNTPIEFVDKDPDLTFNLEKADNEEYIIVPNFDIYKIIIFKGKDYKYVLTEDKLYKCTKEFENTNLKLINIYRENYLTRILLNKNQLGDLFSVVIPRVKNAVVIEEKIAEEVKEYQPENLGVKVFLDFNEKGHLVADVKLCYGDNEFNPLDQNEEKEFKHPRNIIEETKAMNIFKKTGFMYDVKSVRFILPDEDRIYNFLTNDINYYMKKFEVLATDNFKRREILKPKFETLGVKIENNLLSIDLSKININLNELENVVDKYKLKKKYYRLKDGSFLDLQDSKEIDFIEKLISGGDIGFSDLKTGIIRVPVNRTLYLDQLLKQIKSTEIRKDNEYKNMVNVIDKNKSDEQKIPNELKCVLRSYQKVGFEWLKVLDQYRFGGILADDMGLGKTIQIISILLDYKQNVKNSKTSIVISPSSLSLNWKN